MSVMKDTSSKKRSLLFAALFFGAISPMTQAAIFNVSTAGQLSQALYDAANNHEADEIVLETGTYDATTTVDGYFLYNSLDNYSLRLTNKEVATGGQVILEGDGTQELLVIQNNNVGGAVVIDGLTFSHGRRGLRTENVDLEIYHSTFKGNTLTTYTFGQNGGGGLHFNHSNLSVTISDSVFEDNLVNIPYSLSWRGGAAYINARAIYIKGTRFSRNSADGDGGALYVAGALQEIHHDTFEGNTSESNGGALAGSDKLYVVSSAFENNSAGNSGGAMWGGKEVYSSRFTRNSSVMGAAAIASSAVPYLASSLFVENKSADTIDGATVYCASTSCQIVFSLFDKNEAVSEINIKGGAYTDNILANNVFLNVANVVLMAGLSTTKALLRNNYLGTASLGLTSDRVIQTGSILLASPGLDATYAPLEDSPLIDKGLIDQNEFAAPKVDYLENSRSVGAAADIGPIEYGSSPLWPKITQFKYVSGRLSELSQITFEVQYELAAGKTLASIEYGFQGYQGIFVTLDENHQFSVSFREAGYAKTYVKVTDSDGNWTSSLLNFTLASLPNSEVKEMARTECRENPESCGISSTTYYDNGVNWCKSNPESCGVNTAQYIQQGKSQCVADPASCGIANAAFNPAYIPAVDNSWKLLGTSQEITDFTPFANVDIVWAQVSGVWKAYSPNAQTQSLLTGKGISKLNSIPAFSGFWVKK